MSGCLCVCAIEAVSHTLVLGPVVLDSDALVLGDVDGRMVGGRLDGWTLRVDGRGPSDTVTRWPGDPVRREGKGRRG